MIRLDKYLAESSLSSSREKAKREILSGWVKVNGETCRNVSKQITGDETVTVQRPGGNYVSRGGYKLEKAIKHFSIDVIGLTVVDLGASTGGFTDCLLKNGAKKVYAVDVGYGQLDYSLRTDKRVVVMERQNARKLQIEQFPEKVDFCTSDLSFISFTKVYPHIRNLFIKATGVSLIKPQFEAERSEHKKGVVKEKKAHINILHRVIESLYKHECIPLGLSYSPIKGPKGNIEFLLYYSNSIDKEKNISIDIENVVNSAHSSL